MGIYAFPEEGTRVVVCFAYGLPNKPYIQSILPHGLSMPKVPKGDQVWQHSAAAQQRVDADGNMLEPPETVTGIGVNAGDTTRISVSFNTMPREPSRVLTTWTVTGTTASTTTCEDAGGVDVVVNLENRPQIGGEFTIIDTATATCDAGALRLMGPGARDYRIAARLYDTFGTPIDTVIVDDLDLRAGSATVAIEFLPPE